MAGDKSVLADHDRQPDALMLRNTVSLHHIIIGFLIILRVDLDPSGVPCAHTVGVVAVDVDRS